MKTIYLFIYFWLSKLYHRNKEYALKKISIKNHSKFNLQTEKDPFNEY